MPIRFVLMVNKQGQTRLSQYYPPPNSPAPSIAEKNALEGEIIRKCLSRSETQCSFFDGVGYTCVYRRYASLFFIVGIDKADGNELGALEFIHRFVEILDEYYVTVCELDIMFNLERAHFILDEMVTNGRIIDTNKTNVLRPIRVMDKFTPASK